MKTDMRREFQPLLGLLYQQITTSEEERYSTTCLRQYWVSLSLNLLEGIASSLATVLPNKPRTVLCVLQIVNC